MGLFSFISDAGKGLFGDDKEEAAAADAKIQELRAERMRNALKKEVEDLGISSGEVDISYENGKAVVKGSAASQEEREKLVLALGNVKGVKEVEESIAVEAAAPESTFYTVVRGDTLSGIARKHYGDAGKYPVIFEANRPLLSDPDKIYPGQTLRIPVLEEKETGGS